MDSIVLKTDKEIAIMAEGGKRLAEIKSLILTRIKPGVTAWEIETLANSLIAQNGGEPSFKKVPNYHWSTCINVNEGVVHGIPKRETVFSEEDIVSVDLGIFYQGFHTDSAFSVYLGQDKDKKRFLQTGRKALSEAIKVTLVGNHVAAISEAIYSVLTQAGVTPVKSLTGHGIGRNLHEEPAIACFPAKSSSQKVELKKGLVVAIEVMYALGSDSLILDDDHWTLSTKDGKIAALFEETVAVTNRGPLVLTQSNIARKL